MEIENAFMVTHFLYILQNCVYIPTKKKPIYFCKHRTEKEDCKKLFKNVMYEC